MDFPKQVSIITRISQASSWHTDAQGLTQQPHQGGRWCCLIAGLITQLTGLLCNVQVKRLEDRGEQLARDKEDLSEGFIALKKEQSMAAGPGQTRTINLMRRVHNLVSPCESTL